MSRHFPAIAIPYEEIVAFCQRHHIRKLSLFGSVLRGDFRESGNDPSDVDVLVEFEEGYTPGWEYYTWGEELAPIFGYPVDLKTAQELSKYFRDRVLAEAVTIYESQVTSSVADRVLNYPAIEAPTTAERDRIALLHLVEESERVRSFVQGRSRDDLEDDLVLNGAVQMTLVRIGRFVSTVSSNLRERTADLDWTHWGLLGSKLIERYDSVDLDEVWRTATEELPPFAEKLEKILLDPQ
jgi:predicted nucleotidyltransferase/uncharacterized protein with HEPN domain